MYAAPIIETSVQARMSLRLSEIAAAMRIATISPNIAQNSVVSGAHFVSSCAPRNAFASLLPCVRRELFVLPWLLLLLC